MPDLSQSDADMIAKTAVSEAGDSGPDAMAAVIASIRNRVNSGRYGDTVQQVILKPGAYEPWGLPLKIKGKPNLNHPLNIDSRSPEYQQAYAAVQDIFGGNAPDVTNGATHFYDPASQAALGRRAPSWARGQQPTAVVPPHKFYAPEGQVVPNPGPQGDVLARWGVKAPDYPPTGSILSQFGHDISDNSAPPQSGDVLERWGVTAPDYQPGEILRQLGHDVEPSEPAPSQPAAPVMGVTPLGIPMEGGLPTAAAWGGEPSHAGIEHGNIGDLPGRVGEYLASTPNALSAAYQALRGTAAQGMADISANRTATGVGELGLAPFAALGAGQDVLIGQPLTKLTGNEQFGELAPLALGAPSALRAAGAATGAVLPSSRAANALIAAVGPENIPEALARLRANPRLSVMDVSQPVLTRAQGLQANPGAAQDVLEAARVARTGGAQGTVTQAYDQALGQVPDVKQLLDSLKARARATGQKIIQPAIDNAEPVDVTSVINGIDDAIGPQAIGAIKQGTAPAVPLNELQRNLLDLRNQLRGRWPDRETMYAYPDEVHSIQSQLREQGQALQKSAVGSERLLGGQLMGWRGQLVDAIDEASGGTYKPALKQYADDLQIQDAFDKGLTIFKNEPSNIENRPEFWRDWISKASPDELNAARTGARVQVDQLMRGTRFAARRGEEIPEVDFNVERLNALFGQEQTQQIIRTMADERAIANTNAKLYAGSQTANKLLGNQAMAVREVSPLLGSAANLLPPTLAEIAANYAGLPGAGALPMIGLGLARKGAQKLGQLSDVARNAEFARLAAAQGAARQPAISILEQAVARPTMRSRVLNALQVGAQALP